MNRGAQAGLEYLMTYGWALILIATIVGALVFVVSGPSSTVAFTSSDPTKFMVKGGAVSAGTAELVLQNITGGKAEITKVTLPGQYTLCTLNDTGVTSGETIAPAIEISAGGEMHIQCSAQSTDSGTISIEYTNYAGLPGTVAINASGGTGGETYCGNNVREGSEQCDGSDLAGQTCVSKGFIGGNLACSGCVFDTSGCVAGPSCGDGTCNPGECASGCKADCSVAKCCGTALSGGCDAGVDENYSSCAQDCCPTTCNNSCTGGYLRKLTPPYWTYYCYGYDPDCPAPGGSYSVPPPLNECCGNGTCSPIEATTCPADCCQSNCVNAGLGTCSTNCNGFNGCLNPNTLCNGRIVGSIACINSTQYVTCCNGSVSTCPSGYTCTQNQCISEQPPD